MVGSRCALDRDIIGLRPDAGAHAICSPYPIRRSAGISVRHRIADYLPSHSDFHNDAHCHPLAARHTDANSIARTTNADAHTHLDAGTANAIADDGARPCTRLVLTWGNGCNPGCRPGRRCLTHLCA